MLPFLQDRDGVMSGGAGSNEEYGALDAIVSDMLEAVKKGSHKHLKSALLSLIEHIKEEDEIQDQSLTKE